MRLVIRGRTITIEETINVVVAVVDVFVRTKENHVVFATVCLSLYLSVVYVTCVSVYMCLILCLVVYTSVSVSVWMLVHLFVSLCVYVSLSVYLSYIRLSSCLN